jgi:hypothetical protein
VSGEICSFAHEDEKAPGLSNWQLQQMAKPKTMIRILQLNENMSIFSVIELVVWVIRIL